MHSTLSVPLCVSASVREAANELALLLHDYGYTPHAIGQIVAHTVREGTPTGSPYLEAEDEADASMIFEAKLEPVDYDSPAWDVDAGAVYLDVDLMIRGEHPFPYNPDDVTTGEWPPEAVLIAGEAPDGPDVARKMIDKGILPAVGLIPPLLEDLDAALPPISGGAPDDEPTEADRLDFEAWLSQVDADYPPADQVAESRAWYARNPLAAFNADRPDCPDRRRPVGSVRPGTSLRPASVLWSYRYDSSPMVASAEQLEQNCPGATGELRDHARQLRAMRASLGARQNILA